MNKEKIFEAVKVAYNSLDEKMGIDIVVMDIAEVSPLADYFIVASASNSSQLKALSEGVEEDLHKKCNIEKIHIEGVQTKSWILLNFNDIVIHIFNEEDRKFYNIERVWADAKIVPQNLLK